MRDRFNHLFGAYFLPLMIGVGICCHVVQTLRFSDGYAPPSHRRPLINDVEKVHVGWHNGAEVRVSVPLEKRYEPLPAKAPLLNEQQALKNAELEKSKDKPVAESAQSESSDSAKESNGKPEAKGKALLTFPTKWRPILDPVSEYWSTLWPRSDALPAMFQAVLHCDSDRIAQLASLGISPDETTLFGDTALCAAARTGQADCIRMLALTGADINQVGRENQPPIVVAAMRRNTKVLGALTEVGADPNTRFKSPVSKELIDRCLIKDLRNALESDRGVTPLICCSARGDVEGATVLLRAGAKAGLSTSRYHRYPINFAATQGYLFLMRVLLGRDPDSEPNILVTIDLSSQRAWVTKSGKVIASTTVSTGRAGYRTPAGRYVITDKHRSHTSTLYHCAMPWFMRLNCSAIGLHSGYVTGSPASHGCIRLPYDKAKHFFGITDVGDEVEIVN